jgi:ABC-type multidrug transport system fused ATPase/permease subunit
MVEANQKSLKSENPFVKKFWNRFKLRFENTALNQTVWSAAKSDLLSGMAFIPVYAFAEVILAVSLGTLMQLIFSGRPRIQLSQIVPAQVQHWFQFSYILDRKDLATAVPVIIVIAGFVKLIGSFFSSYLIERSGHCVSRNLRQELLGRVLNAKANTMDALPLEDLSNRILGDTAQLQSLLTKGSISALRDGIVMLFLCISMFLLAPKLMLILLCLLLPGFFILRRVTLTLGHYTKESLKLTSDMGTQIVQLWANRLTVHALGAQKIEQQRLTSEALKFFEFIKKSFVLRTGFRPLMELSAAILIVALFALKLKAPDRLDSSTVTTLLVLGAMSYRPLKQLAGIVGLSQELRSVYLRVHQIWKWLEPDPNSHRNQTNHTTLRHPSLRSNQVVNMQDLSVNTADGKILLENCHLKVFEGDSLGIIGQSGAGKSTLLRALAESASVSAGQLEVIENKLLAPQFPFLFRSSVVDNIFYSTESVNLENLDGASLNKIQSLVLSLGLAQNQTMVDFFLQKNAGFMGANLSGGERARVSLARILLRSPKLLLLDEPTANLDPESSRLFWQAVLKWKSADSANTLICVSHAQSEWVHFSRLIELQNGRILEERRAP